jgi:TonB-dependent SusC/RagA subfamily outer membrane receptor
MMAVIYYILKVILCSGVLFFYYHLALRNNLFHQWNRFYLLLSVLISIIAPIVQVSIMHPLQEDSNQAIKMLQVFQSADGYLEDVTIRGQHGVSIDQWLLMGYLLISFILFISLLLSLNKIFAIITTHTVQLIERIRFINTNAEGTPFSFFNFVFWNEQIDLQTETGQQIFRHELVHIKEKHTLDKLMMELIMTFCWSNPFFWLIRRELQLIHEFIADKKAIGEQGAAALAAMILSSSYPTQFNSVTNQFFQTSIKRRLAMLAKIQNPRLNYVSRVLALPILLATVLAFTVRTKNIVATTGKLKKEITVVIDAAHGMQDGHFSGARDGNVFEDEIVLSIARKIEQLNTSNQVKIVLTRPSQEYVDLHKRVDIARYNNADLFISLHVNATPPVTGQLTSSDRQSKNGFEVLVPGRATTYQKESEILGSAIVQELGSIHSANTSLVVPSQGVFVLDKNVCPSVLIECGFITDKMDRAFITDNNNQAMVAKKILTAIERYASKQPGSSQNLRDTVPQKQLRLDQFTIKDSHSSAQGQTKKTDHESYRQNPPLYIVDGKEINKQEMDKIDPASIESINVLKGDTATSKYGEKAANGVIEIRLKSARSTNEVTLRGTDTMPWTHPIFTKVEKEASIDKDEWLNFLRKNLQPVIESSVTCGMKPGTYTVQLKFVVRQDGTLSDIRCLNDPGFTLAEKTLAFMKSSPRWNPGVQNGRLVDSYHTQPVTYVIEEN